MSVDLFFKLKEIDSLSKMRINHLKTIDEQVNRVSILKNRLNASELDSKKALDEKISYQNDLGDLEAKLKNASVQKQRLIDIGSDENKVAQFSIQIENFEEEGLNLLGLIEEKDLLIKEGKTFREGLCRTIDEIQNEVSPVVENAQKEIGNLETRIELLKNELPSQFQSILAKITAKNLVHGPFTRIEQGSCFICRFKISRIDESEIDMQKGLKTCPQCSRIFLPYGAS